MDTKRSISFGVIAFFLMAMTAPVPGAETAAEEGGIPSTAIARLNIGKGTAWVRPGGSADWEEAASNFPLAERTRVSVPQGSEAEIQYRGSQFLLLQGGSEVDIRQLGETEVSYRLRSGKALLSLPKEDFAPVRITVPGNREIRVDAPGRYTVSTDGGITRFLVRNGEGAVAEEDGSPIVVQAGEEASIGEEIRISRIESAAMEPVPEATLTGSEEEAGVPPAVASELRQYGEWVPTPEYGYAWRPYVDDGWEPYDYGRWTWVSPYGWTWVGYEPWGWWPYHTGWWWPSPVFGWVWCPFRSFVSVDFTFGHSRFHGHHSRFFPANARFVGRDRFVRWVPSGPGERRSDSRSIARNDRRLARWDRPVDRGSVRVRRDGGEPVAWEGRGGRPQATRDGRRAATPGVSRDVARPHGSRLRDGGSVRSTDPRGRGSAGSPVPRGGGSFRSPGPRSGVPVGAPGPRGGGSVTRRGPVRSFAVSAPASRAGGMTPETRRGFSRGSAGKGSRGDVGSFRSVPGGGNRGNPGNFRDSRIGGSRVFGGGARGSGRTR